MRFLWRVPYLWGAVHGCVEYVLTPAAISLNFADVCVVFIRALSMHLQICWDVTPGKKFFYWAQGLGWSVAATFFTITITITGVSFRFGDVCHVNAAHSMQDFWGPLLAIAGAAMVIQIAT